MRYLEVYGEDPAPAPPQPASAINPPMYIIEFCFPHGFEGFRCHPPCGMGFEDLLYKGFRGFSRPPLLQLYLLPILLLLRLTLTEFSLSSFSIVACESLP